MILSTTLAELKKHGACESGYKRLAKHLGGARKYGMDTPIDLLTILEGNGVADCIWALRAAVEPERDKIARLLAADCAESVLPIFEIARPGDPRPRQVIQVVRDYAVWVATDQQLDAARATAKDAARATAKDAAWAAAWAAAKDAAWAAAWAAAKDAAWAAAEDAARAAAWAAAKDAAWAAARDAQRDNLAKYLRGEKP